MTDVNDTIETLAERARAATQRVAQMSKEAAVEAEAIALKAAARIKESGSKFGKLVD